MSSNTPKHFAIQLGALIALYAALTSLLIIIFSVVNLRFPDSASYYWESEAARTAIRSAMAMLIVFFPTYLWLTRTNNQQRRSESNGAYTTLARWLIYLSLLGAGGVLLGDLVVLINYFLNGEITTRFLIKVFALLVVVGATFHYYVLDVRGYFANRTDKAMYFASGAVVLVVVALTLGYRYIETPAEVREMRLDELQVNDLQNAQSYVENYYLANQTLPDSLAIAYGALPVPTAPVDRTAYSYVVKSEQSYELCATFSSPSANIEDSYAIAPEKNFDWTHQAGEWCFTRTVIEPSVVKPPL